MVYELLSVISSGVHWLNAESLHSLPLFFQIIFFLIWIEPNICDNVFCLEMIPTVRSHAVINTMKLIIIIKSL